MNSKSSLFFLPPNLRNSSVTPLEPHIAGVMDRALELAYYSEINKLKHLYDPTSEFYDTDYILNLLGQNTLKNLLANVTDKISLTMILSDIQNIKGTKKAFYAILKLLNINPQNIVFRKLANGCTEITLVFPRGQRIDLNSIAMLDKFAQEVFPLCLSLTGITNCITYDQSATYSGFNTVDLGMHYLDRTFVLDMSKMDTTYGIIDPRVSSSIAVLICNATYGDVSIASPTPDVLNSRTTYGYLTYGRGLNVLLDRNLVLDRFSPIDYYGFDTLLSKQTISGGSLNVLADDTIVQQSQYQFRLDRDLMDVSIFKPLTGYNGYYKETNSLDRGTGLDIIQMDRKTRTLVKPTKYYMNNTVASMAIAAAPAFDTQTISQKVRLDYAYSTASQFIPMFNI